MNDMRIYRWGKNGLTSRTQWAKRTTKDEGVYEYGDDRYEGQR